jgi:hypothetical protein
MPQVEPPSLVIAAVIAGIGVFASPVADTATTHISAVGHDIAGTRLALHQVAPNPPGKGCTCCQVAPPLMVLTTE